ncbi:PspC domain-containing protein [Streptomyces sp. CC228A]|uniref:PspC domain-containing protein n=1 Tax=Streptomyces sp. CC228A TaxID=2898186 RepID=UPI0022A87DE7|nr:PspC domain-containing protein [Streptomyces sp. CC228A]
MTTATPPPAAQPGATGPDGAPDRPAPHPPLRRTRQKVMAGVCGGLGRHFDLDPVVFRVATGVLAVAGGIGLIFYGFAWLLLPAEGEEETEARRLLSGRVGGSSLTAVLMALVGCGLFLTMLGANRDAVGFAILLVFAVSGAAVWSQRRSAAAAVPGHEAAPAAHGHAAVVEAPPEAKAPPPPGAPSWWRDPIVKDGSTGPVPVGYLWGPPDSPAVEREQPWGAGAAAPAPPPPKEPAPRSIGGLVLLLALLAGGVCTAASWGERPFGAALQIGLAAALAVFGLGLVLSSLLGRTGFGTLFMTVVTALLLAGAAVVPREIDTRWGHTGIAPASAAELRPHYDLGNGEATLDLRDLPVAAGTTTGVSAELGMGRLHVVVPRDVTVAVRAEVGMGAVLLPGGQEYAGPDQDVTRTLPPPEGVTPGGTLELTAETVVGVVEVTRAAS